MLIGSVRKAGDRVRITAQLVNAANDAQVWGERYDRDLTAIFELQDEISKAIAAALKLTLLPAEKAAIEQRATTNLEAYKLYLIGRQLWQMDNSRNSELCVRICTRVVELDPNYAQAWATLALAQWDVFHRGESTVSGEQAAARPSRSIRSLPTLRPPVAESHRTAGGLPKASSTARKRYASILLLHVQPRRRHVPDGSPALQRSGGPFRNRGGRARIRVRRGQLRRAVLRGQRRHRAGREAARRALTRIEKVISVQPDHSRAIGFGVGLLATLGEKERAREWVLRGQLLDPRNVIMLYNFSCAMVQLRDLETAFELLRDFTSRMDAGLMRRLESDSDFDPIRDDPRFSAMLKEAKQRLGVET